MKKAFLPVCLLLLLFVSVKRGYSESYSASEAKSMMSYGDALFDAQEYGLAKEAYLKLIYLFPANNYGAEAQYKVGLCLQRQDNYAFAYEEWKKVVKKYPGSGFAQKATDAIQQAEIYLQVYEPPILDVDEKFANKYINFGEAARDRMILWPNGIIRRYDEFNNAMHWYDKAMKACSAPDVAGKVQVRKAELYRMLAQEDTYSKYVRRLREEDRKNLINSIGAYQVAIDSFPNTYWSDTARLRIGDIYRDELRDKESALKVYQDAESYFKNKSNKSYYTEYCRTQINYLKTSFDEETKIVAASMQDWEMPLQSIQEQLAKKYIDLGGYFKNRSVRGGDVGTIYLQEELDTALFFYNEAIKVAPNTEVAAKAQYSIGDAYMFQSRQVDYGNAIKEYQKVIDNYPNTYFSDQAGIQIGDVCQNNLNDKGAAIEAYKALIIRKNKDKSNYFVCNALAQIKYLGGSLDFMK